MPISDISVFQIERLPEQRIARVWLNKPDRKNAMGTAFWRDLPAVAAELDADASVRAVVIQGRGEHFSIGLDLKEFYLASQPILHGDVGEVREQLLHHIQGMQKAMDAVAYSPKPWIAAMDGWCIGAGLDLAAACDVRLCTAQTQFSLREARVGIVADMGSLNRLPGIIGQGNTRLLAFTGRDIPASEAWQMQLVSRIYPDATELGQAALALAAEMAANSRMAVQGSKAVLNHLAEGHGVRDSLHYVALWNAAFLDSRDFREAIQAFLEKRAPNFG